MAQRIVSFLLAVALFVCIFGTQSAQAWGKEGHMAVADIAYSRLTVAAQQAVDYYLNGVSMADAAPYPDKYAESSAGRWSEPLHYCNLPRDATDWQFKYCPIPPSCVVEAILNNTKLLTSEGNQGAQCQFDGSEPCPLVYLIHFVGDIHQPLHVGYGYDRGGNEVKVTFFGKSGNLHEVWDTLMIERWTSSYSELASDLENLIQQEPAIVNKYLAVTNPNKWANESFSYVRSDVYDFTPNSRPARAVALGAWYDSRNLPIVQQRLIAASVRLAQLINSILG